ncbi:MAG: HPF/RaiA family ribosome-associated protein [Nitrospirae bacterium]|nr:HPF/RaiA family ribosome-associated protein [Nitrospirota bacterium]
MIYHVTYKNMEPMTQVEPILEEKILKIETLLPTFDEDTVSLQVTFERQARREEYYASLTLTLPRGTLRAKDQGFDPLHAMNLAFDEMLREVKKFKDTNMKKEHTYKERRLEKTAVRPIPEGTAPEEAVSEE